MSNKHKNPTISFRVSDAERKQIEARILASGLLKRDYFVRSCICNHICVVGKKETIYPLLKITQELYQRLTAMYKSITACDMDISSYSYSDIMPMPTNETINELQEDFTNMLIAIIDILDGLLQFRPHIPSFRLTTICDFRFQYSSLYDSSHTGCLILLCSHIKTPNYLH